MARSDKPGMIDGFMSVQAVRHQGDRAPDQKPAKDAPAVEKTEASQSDSAQPQKKASIGHTALPSRHELICYSCGYAFVVTGALNKVFCAKCREQLETGDHSIEGEWKQDIRTVGKVHVKQGATVVGATIIATDIVIGGDCSQAKLQPTRRIELGTGAATPPGLLDEHPVHIRAGSRLSLTTTLRCKTLDVYGELQATAEPTGMVTIHPGGMFRGRLKASHLVVHDGGGLSADLNITPEAPAKQAPKAGTTKTSPSKPAGVRTPAQKAKTEKPAQGASAKKTVASKKAKRTTSPSKTAPKRSSQPKGKKRTSKPPPRKVE